MTDEYQTIVSETEGLFKDKGSKFFGFAFPIKSEEDVKEKLEYIKSLHPKARHYCYAYRLDSTGENFRANDDGEPSGSAGKPILNTLVSMDITDALVIVVRYFGGTLLGVPGLINAYKEATREALELAKKETRYILQTLKIEFDFEHTNPVMQTIKKLEINIIEQTFTTRSGLVLEVRESYVEKLKEELKEYWNISYETSK